ncbi:MAG TPA: ABC transporter substrate-binding protein [Methylomirabilota bacterium]|nr:ABC transporter substrate-binding protein [Methylomirabilota bacterium]
MTFPSALLVLALGTLTVPLAADAQPAAQSPRIGILASTGSASSSNIASFRQGLRDLGYVEGQNIVIENRYARRYEELPNLVAELVHLKVEVIFAAGSPAARVVKESLQTIPVVFVTFADPVRSGLVASLARPGQNLTGLTMAAAELDGKRLGLLREALPKVFHVAVLLNPASATSAEQLRETEDVAGSLGMRLRTHEVRASHEFDGAFAAMRKDRADALYLLADSMFFRERSRIAALAAKSRLPAMFQWRAFVDAGGLMSYGPSFVDLNWRAATYVDKILKGAKPADLPVERPTKFELVINLKTARALGLMIPQSLLLRADRLIE